MKRGICQSLSAILTDKVQVLVAGSGEDAFKSVDNEMPQLVIGLIYGFPH